MGHRKHIEGEYMTRGSQALRAHIAGMEMTIPAFCELHALQRIAVQRAINGERKRMSVELAEKISHATDGRVPVHFWTLPPDMVSATGTG